MLYAQQFRDDPQARDRALQAYDCALASYNPDWQAVAEALRGALVSVPPAGVVVALGKRRRTASPAPRQGTPSMADYAVDRLTWRKLQWPSPILEVTFADGTVVRAPAVSRIAQPINVGRGCRLACAFYQSRKPDAGYVPEIVACVCGDQIFDPVVCNAAIGEARAYPVPRDPGFRSIFDPRDYYRRLRRNLSPEYPAKAAWALALRSKHT